MSNIRDAFSTACPGCGSSALRVTGMKNNFRPRGQMGTLATNQDRVSTSKGFACKNCGHAWTETVKAK